MKELSDNPVNAVQTKALDSVLFRLCVVLQEVTKLSYGIYEVMMTREILLRY